MDGKKCLALYVPGRPDVREAARLARDAVGNMGNWGTLEVEMFPGREETLLLIHPAGGIYISESAVRFLAQRFGD